MALERNCSVSFINRPPHAGFIGVEPERWRISNVSSRYSCRAATCGRPPSQSVVIVFAWRGAEKCRIQTASRTVLITNRCAFVRAAECQCAFLACCRRTSAMCGYTIAIAASKFAKRRRAPKDWQIDSTTLPAFIM
jgi:hypothetical protein